MRSEEGAVRRTRSTIVAAAGGSDAIAIEESSGTTLTEWPRDSHPRPRMTSSNSHSRSRPSAPANGVQLPENAHPYVLGHHAGP